MNYISQAGLELRVPLASASRMLQLKECATLTGVFKYFHYLRGYSGNLGVIKLFTKKYLYIGNRIVLRD